MMNENTKKGIKFILAVLIFVGGIVAAIYF